jgi:hypothetical protein
VTTYPRTAEPKLTRLTYTETRTKRRRRLPVLVAVVVAIVVVVVAIVTIPALRSLVFGGSSPGTSPTNGSGEFHLTVTGVEWTLSQGKTSQGNGWFGPSPTYTNSGFPRTFSPNNVFSVTLVLSNYDDVAHTIYTVVGVAPVSVTSTTPTLPVGVPAGTLSFTLQVTFQVSTLASNETLEAMATVGANSPPP